MGKMAKTAGATRWPIEAIRGLFPNCFGVRRVMQGLNESEYPLLDRSGWGWCGFGATSFLKRSICIHMHLQIGSHQLLLTCVITRL